MTASLVRIPWQPTLFLTPHTLDLFTKANRAAGAVLMFNGPDSAWRKLATQEELYNGWMLGKPGYELASNPYYGQRSHMRGAAGDVVRQDPAAQNALRSVGLIRDAIEPWHWNDPLWASMPIIPDLTSVAGGNSTPIQEDDDMQRYEYFQVPGNPTQFISLNRAGYWPISGQDKRDYDYYIHDTLGQPIPGVQEVKNPSAFGPRLK